MPRVSETSASLPAPSAVSDRLRTSLLDNHSVTNQCKRKWTKLAQMVTNWADSKASDETGAGTSEVTKWGDRVTTVTQDLRRGLQRMITIFDDLIGDMTDEQKAIVDTCRPEMDTAIDSAKTTPATTISARKREEMFEALAAEYGSAAGSRRQMSRIGGKMTVAVWILQEAIRSAVKFGISDEAAFAKLVATARVTSQRTLASIDEWTSPVTSAET